MRPCRLAMEVQADVDIETVAIAHEGAIVDARRG